MFLEKFTAAHKTEEAGTAPLLRRRRAGGRGLILTAAVIMACLLLLAAGCGRGVGSGSGAAADGGPAADGGAGGEEAPGDGAGHGTEAGDGENSGEDGDEDGDEDEDGDDREQALPEPGPGEAINPLTGMPHPEEELDWRYVLVSMDNLEPARPQSGLPGADLVYEILTEGGVTRLFPLFRTEGEAVIGPVRSSRHYVLDLAMEWDAVLVHVGGSPQHYARVGGTGLKIVDDMTGGAGGNVFWRSADRRAPHNLYTSGGNLRKKLTERGWEPTAAAARAPFQFVAPADLPESEPVRELVVKWPGHRREIVTFRYIEDEGHYVRFYGPSAHTDAATGEPLTAGSILIQYTSVEPIPGDTEGRIDVSLVGEGPLLIVSGGGAREGRWHKGSGDGPTGFYEADGTTPVNLVPGQVWILVVSDATGVETN